MAPTQETRLMNQEERVTAMLRLAEVVRLTGAGVQNMPRAEIFDTVEVARHQFSTVDAAGANLFRATVEQVYGGFRGTILEESEIPRILLAPSPQQLTYPLLVCDAVEGSTNAKRGLAASIRLPIRAGTSALILEGENLSTIAASAFYDFASKQVFSSVRAERGSFLAFIDGHLLLPEMIHNTRGDSHAYAAVPGYSHGNIQMRAQLELALLEKGVQSTGGSRSSAQDLVDLLGNQNDAYVDLRALFPGGENSRDEVLHTWDVGGLLPVLHAAGFIITDPYGLHWQQLEFGKPLALIVARPTLYQTILASVKTLPCLSFPDAQGEAVSVRFPLPNIG